jgi:hypothetical protein
MTLMFYKGARVTLPIPLIATVALAMLSITFQVAKASRAIPVDALKYE